MRQRAAFVMLALAAAAPQPQYFRYRRPLTAPAKAGQTCVVLDAPVFAHAAPGLADLRLYRDSSETPYATRTAAAIVPAQQQIPPLNLGHRGTHTTFEAVMPEGRYSDIDLAIGAKDFIATVAVTGAQDESGREGSELGMFTIFDLTSQKLGRSTVLHLPLSDFRYLYFSIEGPVKPGDVHGLSVVREPAQQAQFVNVAETSQVRQQRNATEIRFTVPAHVPVDRVEFVAGAAPANFSREVTVKITPVPKQAPSSEDEVPRMATAQGNLLRVHAVRDGHRIDEEQLTVNTPVSGFGDADSVWTVSVDNGDDPPLAISAVRLEMAQRRLCFDAAPGASYSLFYGDSALSAPRYDYATLFTPEQNPSLAQLGPEQLNSQYRTRPDERPFTEKHPALLWTALIAVVLVLGAVALRTAKRSGPGITP